MTEMNPVRTQFHLQNAEFVGRGLMEVIIQELKQLARPWQAMSEVEQSMTIHRCRMAVEEAVETAIASLAAYDRPKLAAAVDQVVFKDGVKVVLKGLNTDAAHALADVQGSSVIVVVADPRERMVGVDSIEPEPDQRDAFTEEAAE